MKPRLRMRTIKSVTRMEVQERRNIGKYVKITEDYGGLLVEVVSSNEGVIALIRFVKVEVINHSGLRGLKLNTALLANKANSSINIAIGRDDEVAARIDEVNQLALIEGATKI